MTADEPDEPSASGPDACPFGYLYGWPPGTRTPNLLMRSLLHRRISRSTVACDFPYPDVLTRALPSRLVRRPSPYVATMTPEPTVVVPQ